MTRAPVIRGRAIVTGEPVPTELTWDTVADGSRLVVRIRGDVCTWSAPRLLAAISDLLLEIRCPVLVLDLSSVGLIDARGVTMIVRLRQCAGLDEVRVESPSAPVERLLSLTACAGTDSSALRGRSRRPAHMGRSAGG